MSDDPSSIGLQHPAFAVSKAVLLDWLNTFFGLRYAKVEECASGAVYCQILDAIYPGQVPMKNVKWNAKLEHEWVANFKIVQKVMAAQNVAKPVPIDKLTKGKYQDNLEFLQWFKHFFEVRYGGQPYDAAARRALGTGGAASGIGGGASGIGGAKPATRSVAQPAARPSATATTRPSATATTTTAAKKPTTATAASPKPKPAAVAASPAAKSGGTSEQKEKLLAQIAELETQMVSFEKERDFYFGKLREVEIYCQNAEGDEFTKEKVVAILYKTEEEGGETTGGEPAATGDEAVAAAEEAPAAEEPAAAAPVEEDETF